MFFVEGALSQGRMEFWFFFDIAFVALGVGPFKMSQSPSFETRAENRRLDSRRSTRVPRFAERQKGRTWPLTTAWSVLKEEGAPK